MKRYSHIISRLFYQPLAITASKHGAICRALEAHLAGQRLPMEEKDDDDLLPDDDEEMPYDVFEGTAVIPVQGIIGKHLGQLEMLSGGCDLDHVSAMLDDASENKEVSRVVLNFSTPGGTVTGVPETARKIASMRKPTIAFSDSECCSAGYWLASQAQYFYASESAMVGSIGVWCAYLDLSRQMQNEGANMQAISSGKFKLLGAYWKPLNDEEKAMLQEQVDDLGTSFRDAIGLRRTLDPADMQGQIFDGQEAATKGLSDGLFDDLGELMDAL